jgi:CRP-like cAMP-binding protein
MPRQDGACRTLAHGIRAHIKQHRKTRLPRTRRVRLLHGHASLQGDPKKEFLLKEGQFCKTINYVESGALRAFHLSPEGKDSTIMFAIADSRVWQLKKEDLGRLYTQVPKFERFFRIIMQNSYIREQLRVLQNLSLSAEERYEIFMKKYPNLLPYVSQKQIAYLSRAPIEAAPMTIPSSCKKISAASSRSPYPFSGLGISR